MSATSFINLRVNSAEQFKEMVSEPTPNTKLFLAFGKVEPWDDESEPDEAVASVKSSYEVWSSMVGGKRIVASDMSHVIPRYNWTANSVYSIYDHESDTLYENTENPFYVLTSQNAVYKCIGNNGGAESTVEPSSFNTEVPVETADGYIWKYMYTVSSAELLRFTTDDWMPVKTLHMDDGSQQWEVQNNARAGSIEHIEVTYAGSGYTEANSANIVISITGDGTGSVSAFANVEGSGVSKITMTDVGRDFTEAEIVLSGGTSITANAATARAIISPPGGHGSDPLYELGGRAVLIDVRLRYDEEGVLPVSNDFRQISLIKDPISAETDNVATASAFSQMMAITTSGTGAYDQDEIVYQGGSLATASFRGRVVWYDEDASKVYLINTRGTPTASRALIGSESFTSRVLASITEPDLVKNSGHVLYLDNIEAVTRSDDQIENFKIVLKF